MQLNAMVLIVTFLVQKKSEYPFGRLSPPNWKQNSFFFLLSLPSFTILHCWSFRKLCGVALLVYSTPFKKIYLFAETSLSVIITKSANWANSIQQLQCPCIYGYIYVCPRAFFQRPDFCVGNLLSNLNILVDQNSEEVNNLQFTDEKVYFVSSIRTLKRLITFKHLMKKKKKWCYYQHWSRDSVSPVCGI